MYEGYLVRPISVNIGFILLLYCCFQEPFSKIIITFLQLFILFAIGELLFVNLFLKPEIISQTFITEDAFGILLTNILILLLALILYKIPKIEQTMKYITKWYSSNKIINEIVMTIVIVIGIAILSYQTFGEDIRKTYLLVTNIFLVCVILFIVGYFKQKATNSRLSIQYDQLLENVGTYEHLLNEKMKATHEANNQLLLIKGMLSSNNEIVIHYIVELLNMNGADLEYEGLSMLSNLPQKGLKGLLYYKIAKMKQNDIMVITNIDANLKEQKLWETFEKYLKDVSRIIGVYIDNAIEATEKSKKKYIILDIELREKDIIFSFSNTYTGTLSFDQMDNDGFSTKGKGKGYGLSLVKDILEKNQYLEQQREINGIYYVQKLIVKSEKENG